MNALNKKPCTFLLADDHSLIRQGLVFLIDDICADCKVTQASNFQQILETITTQKIDIAILDAQFPEGNILSILPEIKSKDQDIKILIFSGYAEEEHALKYIKAGAHGFLSKMSEEEDIKNAQLKMKNKGEYFSETTQALLIHSLSNPENIDLVSLLTERELQIAEMYVAGLGNLEIANSLDIKQNTVSTLKKRVFDKLKIENIVQLIAIIKGQH